MSDEINPYGREGQYTNNPSEVSAPPPPKRNVWVWVIAVILLMGVGTLVCCGGLAFFGVRQGVAAVTAPVDSAVEALNDDAVVAEKLGTPITSSSALGVQNYENHNGNGGAGVNFNAVGPSGSASVSGRMKLTAGQWSPESLTIKFSDGTEATIPESADVGIGATENP